MRVSLDGRTMLPMHGTTAGLWMYAESPDAQLVLTGHPPCRAVASLDRGHQITLRVPLSPVVNSGKIALHAMHLDGTAAKVTLRLATGQQATAAVGRGASAVLRVASEPASAELCIELAAQEGPASVRLDAFEWSDGQRVVPLAVRPQERAYPQQDAVASAPAIRPAIEQALIEWDWRMQDGIGTPREPRSYAQAIELTFARGDRLLADLGVQRPQWTALRTRCEELKKNPQATDAAWEALWLDVHRARRELVLSNPLADVGAVVFVKHVPSTMSHQLTQYYGYEARPGGGVFLLPQPGRSMAVRRLSAAMPEGNYLHPELSYDARQIYFAFCECTTASVIRRDPAVMDRRYHLYVMNADGSGVRRLTDGPYDDFSPKCLPSGRLLFISTRRGGFHRCGAGPCYVYTLALAEADGSLPHAISFHETNEWDPTVLHDGRVLYTRWDYVDRNAVFYQQLWTARQDGSHVGIYYGNNTYNPVGTWEARPVPGSSRVMATAAPHHGMTAGSIILLDVARAIDGPGAITRLTPDALFPEAESGLAHGVRVDQPIRYDDPLPKTWGPQSLAQPTRLKTTPAEELRWPGHCYRSPYPLSEKHFLAAYSYDRLRGEPGANRPNMFGLYLCDAFGNKELLYRDPNISSQWPLPLRPRRRPPVLEMPGHWAGSTPERPEGTFLLQNVYASWPKLPDVEIRRLRIVQVLPKTTPHANNPRVGAAHASPGKQILGTVPVERDGSAYFRVPARTPVTFQALDARGRAVQTMRSLTYLQPGEQVSCVGCHEPRSSTSPGGGEALAMTRAPSTITPGPDGSRPLSYPLLVQPVLERHCVGCHNAKRPEGKVLLTGEPAGKFSQSYNALITRVSYTAWGNPQNNFEPLTTPDRFGARASKLVALLDRGHYDVKLSADEWERIVTWIDANALFYGTFNPDDQARQLRGERIAGPGLE
jgi:mono/diheme cytochrome c family protein